MKEMESRNPRGPRRIRGIEAAIVAFRETEEGAFASEALRRVAEQVQCDADLVLASSLVYALLRRRSLWEHLLGHMVDRDVATLDSPVRQVLLLGVAGMFSLRNFAPPVLANGLVNWIGRERGENERRFVNAVLRHALERGTPILRDLEKSSQLSDMALRYGVPGWIAERWEDEWGKAAAKDLLRLGRIRPYVSLRCAPGADRERLVERIREQGMFAWPSPTLATSIRLASSAHPPSLPGFAEGAVTPQSESSMLIGEAAASCWKGGDILDLCAGRGGKTGMLAQRFPKARVEAWEPSSGRCRAWRREMKRIGVQATLREGDALDMTTDASFRFILVDAPCSGSGTWERHPDGKWRTSPEDVRYLADLQRHLLDKALTLVQPGGHVLYATCSLLREENEYAVADAMSRHPNLVELPVEGLPHVRRGRPWGQVVLPTLPWLDGFYFALLYKRPEGGR